MTFPHTLRFATAEHADETKKKSLVLRKFNSLCQHMLLISNISTFLLYTYSEGWEEILKRKAEYSYLVLQGLKMCSEVRCWQAIALNVFWCLFFFLINESLL